MQEKRYKLYGFMNLFNITPDFVYPIFENNGKYYFQNSSNYTEIEEFEQVQDNYLKLIKPLTTTISQLVNVKEYYTIEDEPVIGFQFNPHNVYLGDPFVFYNLIEPLKHTYDDILHNQINNFQNDIKITCELKKERKLYH